jgi:nucleotide-binding universal stress UspA family protein
MHLTVGYLATPTGDDGVALASALANTFGATVDVVLVVREEFPDGHPGRAEYQQLLVRKGEEWIAQATSALSAAGVSANPNVLVGESYSESLIAFAEEKDSDLIVIGGARDGIFGGHVIGSVAGALLHCSPIPVALAPRGYAEDPPAAITSLTAAVPTRAGDDNPLPFTLTLASAAGLPIRMVSPTRTAGANSGRCRSLRRRRTWRWLPARCRTRRTSTRWLPTAPPWKRR